jgi:porin-like protein
MKMVKSLLLGTAAGLVAVAGAQAADMPVKAAPVQYVKICSLYGDGFYYIPNTDTCIKMGGYARVQAEYNMGGGGVPVGDSAGGEVGQGRFNRDTTNDINYRVRGAISWDIRQQTEYGTLRTYIRFGAENTTPNNTGGGTTFNPFWDRAFIQFAGFTVGRSQSFFSSPTAAPTAITTCASPVTPAPRARTSGPIPPSSATASRAPCRSKTPPRVSSARWT